MDMFHITAVRGGTEAPPMAEDYLMVRYILSPAESECHQCLICGERFLHSLSLFCDILKQPPRPHLRLQLPARCRATGVKRSSYNELDTVCLPSLDAYLLLLFLLIDLSLHPS